MSSLFTKRIITNVPEETQEKIDEGIDDEFEFTDSMGQCLDDAEDMALFLIANGVDASELATFVKINALLGKANFNKDVTPVIQKKWTKTMDENALLSIPLSYFQAEYEKRTTVRKSVVNALAAFLHLDKRPQMYVSTDTYQESRGEVPDKFSGTFSSYEKHTADDTKTSQDYLMKSVKSGVDSYRSYGGVLCVESIDVDSPKFVSTIVSAATAYQKDKSPLIAKMADPFGFVCNNIDTPKAQALEHMAMKRLRTFCPNTVFYSVSDKCSQFDVENHQLKSLPDNYAPYLKFKTTGVLGDVHTNYKVLDYCGVDYEINDFESIPEKDRGYDDVVVTTSPDIRGCLDLMSSPCCFDTYEGYKFGDFIAERFIPARLNRIASVADLDKFADYFQLISLTVLAGARKKDGRIFNSHRFYFVDVESQTCLAVPIGYTVEFASFSHIEGNRLDAAVYNSSFVTTNNVSQYASASSELMSYLFPFF